MTIVARAISTLSCLRRAVVEARGWRRAAIASAAGLASVLALAPFFFWPVLFLTLPVLVWLVDGCAPDRIAPPAHVEGWGAGMNGAAVAGWWFGFGYFFAGLFWVGEAFLVESERFGCALPFAVTLLPAGLALFWAAAAAVARAFWWPGISRVLVLAAALSCAEWMRGHVLTGFPWNVLGYALTSPLVLMQGASAIGIYGLTLVAVVVFSTPLVLLAEAQQGTAQRHAVLMGLAIAALPLALLAAYGAARLGGPPDRMHDGVRLRIVQPSVPQREKWRPENQGAIFRDHLDLSRRDEAGRRDDLVGITHLVWPEAAMPFLPLEHPEAVAAIGDLLPPGTYLLTGALRRESETESAEPRGGRRAFNSLMVFGPEGDLTTLYDKIHLVPFGEYLPFQASLEALGLEQLTRWRGGFSAGPAPRPLLGVAGLPPVGALVCYEAIFPGEIAPPGSRPGLLVNVTNDGWFGNTTGPQQHFHQARVRAVEEGLPLVRVANNGISAVIDAYGRVIKRLGLNERGVLDSGLPESGPPTLYARFGDAIFALAAIALAALAMALARRNGGQ